GARVGRMRTSHWVNAIETSVGLRALAQISRKCSTITPTANSPDRRHMRSPRWRSPTKITLRRFRSFIVLSGNQKNPQWHFPRTISKRAALKLSVERRKLRIFMRRLPRPEIRILFARMRELPRHLFSQREEEKSMR